MFFGREAVFVRLVEMLILFGGKGRYFYQVNSDELFKADHVLPNDIMSPKPQKTSLPIEPIQWAPLPEKQRFFHM